MSPTSPHPAGGLSDDDLRDVLGLLRGSDSAELKFTVAVDRQRSAVAALGLDPLEAQIRLIHFFDTPDLRLERAGMVVRARRVQGKGDDSTVKLRPVRPEQLSLELRRSPSFVVEVDAIPGSHVCSGSLKGRPKAPGIRETVRQGRALRRLFTKQQRALFAEHAPDGLSLDDLTLLGPLVALKLKGTPEGFERKLVVELWLYPDGSRLMELSTRTAPGEVFDVAARLRAFLHERDIEPGVEQETKTRKALEFFASAAAAGRGTVL